MSSDIRVGRRVQDSPQNQTLQSRTRQVGRQVKNGQKCGTSLMDVPQFSTYIASLMQGGQFNLYLLLRPFLKKKHEWFHLVRISKYRKIIKGNQPQPSKNLNIFSLRPSLSFKPKKFENFEIWSFQNFRCRIPNLNHLPHPFSHFYFDIKFGDRLYSKERRRAWPLLF